MNEKDLSNFYLQNLLTCILQQEQQDLLKQTNVYRHELKQAAIRFERELNKIIQKDADLIWGINDQALYHQMDYLKDLIREVSTLKAEDNGIIAKMIQQYKMHPEAILEACKIELIEAE
jgi:hypothetical protein